MDDEDDEDDEEERGIFQYADGDEEGAIGLNKQTAKQWWKWLPVTVPLLVSALEFCFSTVEHRQLGARVLELYFDHEDAWWLVGW